MRQDRRNEMRVAASDISTLTPQLNISRILLLAVPCLRPRSCGGGAAGLKAFKGAASVW